LKTWPKKLVGYLPLAFALPNVGYSDTFMVLCFHPQM
jgi:hypothetical protein